MKAHHYILLVISFLISFQAHSQTISCQDLFSEVSRNYDTKDQVTCIGSSALVKAYYYQYEGMGFVVAYLKSNEYDFYGKPYIFCGISRSRWTTFKADGIDSWGKAFHKYLETYSCNCY